MKLKTQSNESRIGAMYLYMPKKLRSFLCQVYFCVRRYRTSFALTFRRHHSVDSGVADIPSLHCRLKKKTELYIPIKNLTVISKDFFACLLKGQSH